MNEQDLYMTTARDAAFEGWEKGEPMYWRDVGPSEIWEAAWKAAMKTAELRSLYRARPSDAPPAQPAAWVGMTDEEVRAAVYDENGCVVDYEDYAAAIEAKLREKNGY